MIAAESAYRKSREVQILGLEKVLWFGRRFVSSVRIRERNVMSGEIRLTRERIRCSSMLRYFSAYRISSRGTTGQSIAITNWRSAAVCCVAATMIVLSRQRSKADIKGVLQNFMEISLRVKVCRFRVESASAIPQPRDFALRTTRTCAAQSERFQDSTSMVCSALLF